MLPIDRDRSATSPLLDVKRRLEFQLVARAAGRRGEIPREKPWIPGERR
jgi:hypothetical protein